MLKRQKLGTYSPGDAAEPVAVAEPDATVVDLNSQVVSDTEGYYTERPDDPNRNYSFPNLTQMTKFGNDSVSVFDWKSADPNSNISALDEYITRASHGLRGVIERVGSDMVNRSKLRADPIYSGLFELITKKADLLGIADDAIQSGIVSQDEYLRIFNAFTELICECHDKTHVMFLKINMERAQQLVDRLATSGSSTPDEQKKLAFAKELLRIFESKFARYHKKADGCIPQDKARDTIDAFSSFTQTSVFGQTENSISGYLCDLYRTSKGPNVVVLEGDNPAVTKDDDDLRGKVSAMIRERVKYGVPDACVLEREKLFEHLITTHSLLAYADAAGTKYPDPDTRCLFTLLQTFHSQSEYDSFWGGTQRPPFPAVPAGGTPSPFTVAAAFECGGGGAAAEYPIMTHPMHETNAGGFQYAYSTFVNWEKIKGEGTTRRALSKVLLAPVIFVYCACDNFTKNPADIPILQKVATNLKERAQKEILIPKTEFLRENGCRDTDLVQPDPLPYYVDANGRLMILCDVWDTEGSKLSNNGTLLLSTNDERVTRHVIRACIRGGLDEEACDDILKEVTMSILGIVDIDESISPADRDRITAIIRFIQAKCGIDLKEMMDRSKFLTALLIKLLTGFEALIYTVDVSLAKSICHLVLTIVRHADVLSVYGKLNIDLTIEEIQNSIDLMCNLIQKGYTLLSEKDKVKVHSSAQEYRNECLKRLFSHVKTEIDRFHTEIVTEYFRGGLAHFMNDIPRQPELRLYDVLYFMTTYNKLSNVDSLFCDENEFVKAFNPQNHKDIMPKCILLKKFMSIKGQRLEDFHVLTDMRSRDWSDKLLETNLKYNPNSTLVQRINSAKRPTRPVTFHDINDIIRGLSLGEACVELSNFKHEWPEGRGESEWSLALSVGTKSRAATETVNKTQLERLLLDGFGHHVRAFIETNCVASGSINENSKKFIAKVFTEASSPFSRLHPQIKIAFTQFLDVNFSKPLPIDCTLSERGDDSDQELVEVPENDHSKFVDTTKFVSNVKIRRSSRFSPTFGSNEDSMGAQVLTIQPSTNRPPPPQKKNATIQKVNTVKQSRKLLLQAFGVEEKSPALTDDQKRAQVRIDAIKLRRQSNQGKKNGGSRKKNKHKTTKKYRTKTRKSTQTRHNKYKHTHTIKRRKSQRNSQRNSRRNNSN